MNAHTELVKDILREFGARTDLRIWSQNTGAARTKTGQVVKFGIKGQADLSGVMLPGGRRIEIECKTGNATQTKEQIRWQAMIEKYGGLYVLARGVDDVRRALDD